MQALLPLHPVWAQVVSLEQTSALFTTTQAGTSRLQWTDTALPKPFAAPTSLPTGLAKERDRRVAEDADRYVKQVAEGLRQRSRDQLLREERAARKRIDIEIAGETARREAALKTENGRNAHWLDLRLRNLGFRNIAIQSQIDAYTGQPKRDALLQRADVQKQIDLLTQQRDALLDMDVLGIIAKQMTPIRAQKETELAAQLTKRREQLSAEVEAGIAHEQSQIRLENEPVPALGAIPPPLPEREASPLALPATFEPSLAASGAEAKQNAALLQQKARWDQEKAHLIAIISLDTRKAVAEIARKRGLVVVETDRSGVEDATDLFAADLRAQWKQEGE